MSPPSNLGSEPPPAAPLGLVRVFGLPQDAASLLTPAERARHAGFPAQKRRDDWLLGRVAAKQAVRACCGRLQRAVPAFDAFSVESLESGAPRVVGLAQPLAVSLTHGHGGAAAWASPAGEGGTLPGVDLERIKQRPQGTFRFYLHAEERSWVEALETREDEAGPRDVAAIVLWALKEAAFKAIQPPRGTGLLDVGVLERPRFEAATGSALLAYRGSAEERASALGVTHLRAGWEVQGDLVLAWVGAHGGRLA